MADDNGAGMMSFLVVQLNLFHLVSECGYPYFVRKYYEKS